MKLIFKDLPCYRDLTQEQKMHKLYSPEHAFDLSRLPQTDIRNDFAAFIFDRASSVSFISLRSEQTNFHNLADFLTAKFSDMEHLTDKSLSEIEKSLKAYLLKKSARL